MKTDVLGVAFDNLTLAQAVDAGAALAKADGFHYVVTPNPEIVELARRDLSYNGLLNRADLVLPDGIGILHAARILGRPLRERVPGIDFAAGLMDRMAKEGGRLFLLGARPGVAEQAARRLEARYPGLTLCGTHDGYFREDAPVVEAIRTSGADVVFVCLGAPKQEQWMARCGPQTGAGLMVGLGGALDVFSGQVKRAPEGWQRLGLEWLYRLLSQPSRFGRMARLPLFLLRAAGARGKQ
ncbi:MAG: WecB/TagA/CpsF family glycosyltransferase [Clostridiales bacterium]|nr:WecB/TagA/CpsF family glycosyltransferase [Clostridiales bacterium]